MLTFIFSVYFENSVFGASRTALGLKRKFVLTMNTSKNLLCMTMIMMIVLPTTTAHGAKNNFDQKVIETVMKNLHAKL